MQWNLLDNAVTGKREYLAAFFPAWYDHVFRHFAIQENALCLCRVRCLPPGFTKAALLSSEQPGGQLKPLPRPCVGCRLPSQVRMLSPEHPLVGCDHNGPRSRNVAGWSVSNSISLPKGNLNSFLKYRRYRLLPLCPQRSSLLVDCPWYDLQGICRRLFQFV